MGKRYCGRFIEIYLIGYTGFARREQVAPQDWTIVIPTVMSVLNQTGLEWLGWRLDVTARAVYWR